ncbi:hypothetical protein ACFSTA_03715 [Ornithinibacillus salinisoli]|uniref:Uncharacterized protein n=1 Tax=Ornithinibacillus salinisoli TaxID=1848459 RepID=A0ABW4VUX7_9BACI
MAFLFTCKITKDLAFNVYIITLIDSLAYSIIIIGLAEEVQASTVTDKPLVLLIIVLLSVGE